jgi:NhaP-type Na+/H+ or K+/H+ antiporter
MSILKYIFLYTNIYIYTRTTVEIYHQVDITFGQGVNTFIYMLGGSIIVGFLIGLICALVTIFQ